MRTDTDLRSSDHKAAERAILHADRGLKGVTVDVDTETMRLSDHELVTCFGI